jgi:nitrite reductase (NADH) small subunit
VETIIMYDWHEIGALDDIPRLGSRVVQTPHGDVAVFRTADDQVFALRDRCPHKGGPLSQGIVHGHRITCPLHNWVLELESGRRSRRTWVAPRIIRCGWKTVGFGWA